MNELRLLYGWSVYIAIALLLGGGCSSGGDRDAGSAKPTGMAEPVATTGERTSPGVLPDTSPLPPHNSDSPSTLAGADSVETHVKVAEGSLQDDDTLLERFFRGSYRYSLTSTGGGDEMTMVIGPDDNDTLGRRLEIIDESGEHSITVITARILSYKVDGNRFSVQSRVNGLFIGARRYPHEGDRKSVEGTASITLEGNVHVAQEVAAVTLVGRMKFSGTSSLVTSYNRWPGTFAMHGWLPVHIPGRKPIPR